MVARVVLRHSTSFLTNQHLAAMHTPVHQSTIARVLPSSTTIALVVLNVEQPAMPGSYANNNHSSEPPHSDARLFRKLWQAAAIRLCADGAANRLHDSLDPRTRAEMLPTAIRGDLDSLRPDVAAFYEARGVPLQLVPDQDTHDFEKCVRYLEDHPKLGSASDLSVVAFGALGGRLDQTMANINMLYRFRSFKRFVLLSSHSLAFLLPAGLNVIEPNFDLEEGTCGLIPLSGRCEGVRTEGLKWDLAGDRPLEFGSLISSSNRFVGKEVTVESSTPLLWTSSLRKGVGQGWGFRSDVE